LTDAKGQQILQQIQEAEQQQQRQRQQQQRQQQHNQQHQQRQRQQQQQRQRQQQQQRNKPQPPNYYALLSCDRRSSKRDIKKVPTKLSTTKICEQIG
jgi:hypothetical protein